MIDPQMGANIILGASAVGSILWAAWERIQKGRIQKASTDAAVSVAGAQEQMFSLMTMRLTSLENDYGALRAELLEERKHSRALDVRLQQYQIQVMKLEALLREKGLTPPPFELVP